MRFNLITRPSSHAPSRTGDIPLSLTIRPASEFPCNFQFRTDREALMQMLRKETDLSDALLRRFEDRLRVPIAAGLLGVELGDTILTKIGDFVD